MFIIPYLKKDKTIWVFMKDGALWKTDEKTLTPKKVVELYLTPNGFSGTVCVKGDNVYFKIDDGTKLKDFYMWDEVLCGAEATDYWRPFFLLDDCEDMYPEYVKVLRGLA